MQGPHHPALLRGWTGGEGGGVGSRLVMLLEPGRSVDAVLCDPAGKAIVGEFSVLGRTHARKVVRFVANVA
jgi:hypothetical protein